MSVDVRVAKVVMGWDVIPYMAERRYPVVTWDLKPRSRRLFLWQKPNQDATIWNPSTNIARALEVVKHMEAKHGYWCRMEYSGPDMAYAEFIMVNGPIHGRSAQTLPLAICEAALGVFL